MALNGSSTPIVPCLWFDNQADEAARFYTSIFPNSRILNSSKYGEAGHEIHGQEAGTTLTVDFELDGTRFTALNGGPHFKFSEAVSFQIMCDTQEEVDYYWDKLREGGDPNAQQCGWLKDKYGLSWQVVPKVIERLLGSGGYEQRERVMTALLEMKKLDIAGLERAAAGG